jgi:hypothetical protein
MWVEELKISASVYHHLPRSLPVNVLISAGPLFSQSFPNNTYTYRYILFAANVCSSQSVIECPPPQKKQTKQGTILPKICLLSWHIFC